MKDKHRVRAYIGVGSNVGDRVAHLRSAVAALGARDDIELRAMSSVYETVAVGPPQPDFLNAVVEVSTDLGPRDLLTILKEIETQIGRTPTERWGPREVDLDLLLYGEERIEEADLVVPHPSLVERAFVLVPLVEIAPGAEIPGHGSAAEALAKVGDEGVRKTDRALT